MKIASNVSHTQPVNYISTVLSAPREMSHQGVGAQCRANAARNTVRCLDFVLSTPMRLKGHLSSVERSLQHSHLSFQFSFFLLDGWPFAACHICAI